MADLQRLNQIEDGEIVEVDQEDINNIVEINQTTINLGLPTCSSGPNDDFSYVGDIDLDIWEVTQGDVPQCDGSDLNMDFVSGESKTVRSKAIFSGDFDAQIKNVAITGEQYLGEAVVGIRAVRASDDVCLCALEYKVHTAGIGHFRHLTGCTGQTAFQFVDVEVGHFRLVRQGSTFYSSYQYQGTPSFPNGSWVTFANSVNGSEDVKIEIYSGSLGASYPSQNNRIGEFFMELYEGLSCFSPGACEGISFNDDFDPVGTDLIRYPMWDSFLSVSELTAGSKWGLVNGLLTGGNYWEDNTSPMPAWCKYDFKYATDHLFLPFDVTYDSFKNQAPVIKGYEVSSGDSENDRMPKTWTLEGSHDDSNWDILDIQQNVPAWGSQETRTYTFTNTTAYRYIRLHVTDYFHTQWFRLFDWQILTEGTDIEDTCRWNLLFRSASGGVNNDWQRPRIFRDETGNGVIKWATLNRNDSSRREEWRIVSKYPMPKGQARREIEVEFNIDTMRQWQSGNSAFFNFGFVNSTTVFSSLGGENFAGFRWSRDNFHTNSQLGYVNIGTGGQAFEDVSPDPDWPNIGGGFAAPAAVPNLPIKFRVAMVRQSNGTTQFQAAMLFKGRWCKFGWPSPLTEGYHLGTPQTDFDAYPVLMVSSDSGTASWSRPSFDNFRIVEGHVNGPSPTFSICDDILEPNDGFDELNTCRWDVSDPNGIVAAGPGYEGELNFTSASGQTESAMLVSNFLLQGEFDIEVFFNIDDFVDPAFPYTELGMGLGYGDISGITLDDYIQRQIGGDIDNYKANYVRVDPVGGGSSTPTTLVSADDDFTGDGIPPNSTRWNIPTPIGNANAPTLVLSKMRTEVTGGSPISRSYVISNFYVDGDFDFEIDLTAFGFGTAFAGSTILAQRVEDSGDRVTVKFNHSDKQIITNKLIDNVEQGQANHANAQNSVKFRIRRVSNGNWNTYYDNGGGWTISGPAIPIGLGPVKIQINTNNDSTFPACGADWDNFNVTDGNVIWPVRNSGGFRIVRSGSIYRFQYYDPNIVTQAPHWGWNGINSYYQSASGVNVEDARVILYANNNVGQITAGLDNFRINNAEVVKWS